MSSICIRFPDGKAKALTLSYDDGVEQDKQLLRILQKYDLKCTFNLNAGCFAPSGTTYSPGTIHRRMTEEEAVAFYKTSGMEIATHGYTHPFLEQLPVNLCNREIYLDRSRLEELFHTFVRGHAYPFGTYNQQVMNLLKANGIVYARTVNSTHELWFQQNQDFLKWDPTCHHNDALLPDLTERFLSKMPEHAPFLFYLWGHSYEFEQNDNWNVIESFAQKVSHRKDIWYATNIEIVNYVANYRRLVFSNDASFVYNPTGQTLYFSTLKKIFCIHPNETLSIC